MPFAILYILLFSLTFYLLTRHANVSFAPAVFAAVCWPVFYIALTLGALILLCTKPEEQIGKGKDAY